MYPTLKQLEERERFRINGTINLIASENIPLPSIREACGDVFMMKYSEGSPKHRYYPGCSVVDDLELACEKEWQKVFKTDYSVNVQAQSGSQANQCAYLAMLNPGDTILSMDLQCGAHITHSLRSGLTGQMYDIVSYHVKPDGFIDYEEVEKLAKECYPKLIIAGGSSYSRDIDYVAFKKIADEVGAYLMADIAHPAGLIAVGLHNSPFGLADFVTATCHKTLKGNRSALVFCKPEYERKMDSAMFPCLIGGTNQASVAGKLLTAQFCQTEDFRSYIRATLDNSRDMCFCMQHDFNIPVVSGGTDTHMFVLDLSNTNIDGAQLQDALERVGVTANKNVIPFDKGTPVRPSGLRIGTPFITSRGATSNDCCEIGAYIANTIHELSAGTWDVAKGREFVKSMTEKWGDCV